MALATVKRGPAPDCEREADRLALRTVLLGVVAILVSGIAVGFAGSDVSAAVAAPARSAASAGPCPDDSGITVVVDPGDLGGPVQVRCVPQSAANGIEALAMADFEVDATVRFSGFVCRIDGRPANDRCVNTPPATAYWSYWVADRGGPWCYSDLGAAVRGPVRGTVEGWSFSRSGTEGAPRSGTFARLSGPQRLPLSDCDRGPAPATPVVPTTAPTPAPLPAPTAPVPPPLIASATTIAGQSAPRDSTPADPELPETTLPPATSAQAPTTSPASTTT
ncbi:MAG: hypothetical protein ACR2OH_14980, partial [Microthrixaceae bacterium]